MAWLSATSCHRAEPRNTRSRANWTQSWPCGEPPSTGRAMDGLSATTITTGLASTPS
uniref:Uncharacterized protein n=1 Tax=uncultured marine virus TaxID=186617 RepID=A0A0F7L327_9VIRU|nr:hypothetical protein [uncultured marine virus]